MNILLPFLFFLLFTLPLAFFPSKALAQTPVYDSPQSTPSANILPTSNFQLPASPATTSPLYTDIMVHNMFHTFSCLMTGTSILTQPCLTYQVTKDAQGIIKSVPVLGQANFSGGALGTTVSIIEALYVNRPIRTSEYLVTLGEDLGLYKEAQAQVGGSGQAILNPVLKLWQVSRNISYVFMILIFVIIGLMVMFRQRINPQTVITAQAAIPGLVIGLLLITFSYFLAALITDMAFIGTNIVGFYFSAASDTGIRPNLVNELATGDPAARVPTPHNILTIQGQFFDEIKLGQITRAVEIFFDSVGDNVSWVIRVFTGLIVFQIFGGTLGSVIPGGIGAVIAAAIAGITGLLSATFPPQFLGWFAYFIAVMVLVYNMVRLLLRLTNNYLNIIFLTITGPFRFLAASLPGRQNLATDWILDMLCNVLAFPAVAAVFYFVAYILNLNRSPFYALSTTGITGPQTFPLFGGLDLEFIRLLLAFGALLATPAIPEIICRILGRVSVAGQLIEQEIGGETAAGQRYYGMAFGALGADVGHVGRAGGAFIGSRQTNWDPSERRFLEVAHPSPFATGWARLSGRPMPPPQVVRRYNQYGQMVNEQGKRVDEHGNLI